MDLCGVVRMDVNMIYVMMWLKGLIFGMEEGEENSCIKREGEGPRVLYFFY